MDFSAFAKRDDLCKKGQSRILYAKDYGVIVKTSKGWFASNDIRWELIGIAPNADLIQPTIGPYSSAKEAHAVYKRRKDNGET